MKYMAVYFEAGAREIERSSLVYLLADIQLEIPAQMSDFLGIRLSLEYRSRYPLYVALAAHRPRLFAEL
jgi:hypothetical protein